MWIVFIRLRYDYIYMFILHGGRKDGADNEQHGSDSSTYDPEGRLVPQSFENMFSKYNKNGDGTLTFGELFTMIKGHRCAADPFGVCPFPIRGFEDCLLTGLTVGSCILRMGINLASHTERWEDI